MKITYIAEIGNNHNGNLALAKEMADAAIAAKADFVKFQVYNLEKFVSKSTSYYEDFKQETLSFDDFVELKKHIEGKNGRFLATPFDEDSLNFLMELGLDSIKISSGDVDNLPLIENAVKTGKELYVSLGGGSDEEVGSLVDVLKKGNSPFTLLHCILSYPAEFQDLNLRMISNLIGKYSCPVGYSDHSLGIEASLGAIALGATTIEKHFTIDRSLPGGDNDMSILPEELERLIREGNNIALALGEEGDKILSDTEQTIKKLVRRKYVAKRNISQGVLLENDDIIPLRVADGDEANGFKLNQLQSLLGRKTAVKINKDELILEKHLS